MRHINRRGFLSVLALCVAFSVVHVRAGSCRTAFARAPDLRFGVISDMHLDKPGDEKALVAALEYFRDHSADGVMIAGDIANGGQQAQLMRCGDCWRKVFPDDKAPDGRHVEKLFIYGNHDLWDKGEINKDLAGAWERAFGEKFEPIWKKSVRGYTFIGAHWKGMDGLPAYLTAHAGEIDRSKPFFYVQHPHPKDTCIGAWAWGHDNGASTKALAAFSNAVVFSGHSHYPLTDERTVWQGAFTSINAASLSYISHDYSLRENAVCNYWGGYRTPRKGSMSRIATGCGKQGMLVSVYGSTLVVGRRDFVKDKSLGEEWVLTVPGGLDDAFAARKAKRSAPEFAAGAKIAVKADDKKVVVSFPPARTVAKCRVFEYEVTAMLVEDDVDIVLAQRRVLAPDFFLPETSEGAPGSCIFLREELTWPGHYVFSARPIECFGKKGVAITSETVVLEAYKPQEASSGDPEPKK